MDYSKAFKKVGDQFKRSPIDFFTESDIQSRLFHELKKEVDRSNGQPLQPRSSTYGSTAMSIGSTSSHRKEFDEYLKQKVDGVAKGRSNSHLTKVHTEVWYTTDFGSDKENKVDIALVQGGDPPNYRPISWVKGKQSLSFEMISTAIEIKYLRSRMYLNSRIDSMDNNDPDLDRLANSLDLGFNGIEKDLENLESLGREEVRDSIFVLFSNYDILRCFPKSADYLKRSDSARIVGEAFRIKIENEYPNVDVFYATPVGSKWLN